MLMPGRKFNSDKAVNGFGGKRKDNEIYGEGNAYDFEARILDPRLVRWLSVDPLFSSYPHQSPYVSMSNNPINRIDPTGMGDHYTKDGKRLGSDGKSVTQGKGKNAKQVDDNKAYTTTQAVFDANTKDGKTDWDAVIANSGTSELSMSNSDLGKFAHMIYSESSGDMQESYGIASATKNYASYKTGLGVNTTIMQAAAGISSAWDGQGQTDNARYSMGAAINAITGGTDYSGGAIKWDGFDLATKGFGHIKPRTEGIEISPVLFNAFKTAWPNSELRKTSGDKTATFSTDFSSGLHVATQGTYIGRCVFIANTVHGRSIFWGVNKDPIKMQITPGMEQPRSPIWPFLPYGQPTPVYLPIHVNQGMKGYEWKGI